MRKDFAGVTFKGNELYTENSVPGTRVYGEQLLKQGGKELRRWDPFRSKLAAAIKQGLHTFPFNKSSVVLYLGAGNGTTISHVADICSKGCVFAVEFSPRAMTDLFYVCQSRKNTVPILGDARIPDEYEDLVAQVDLLYQDVAQRDQVDLLVKNAEKFLKPGGFAFLMVKARSIDVTKKPSYVFNEAETALREHFKIIERVTLDPYEKDHACILVKRK